MWQKVFSVRSSRPWLLVAASIVPCGIIFANQCAEQEAEQKIASVVVLWRTVNVIDLIEKITHEDMESSKTKSKS